MRQFLIGTLLILCGSITRLPAQSLPGEWYFSPDGRMLHAGGGPTTGLYQKDTIRTLELTFGQSNWWQLLEQNYQDQIDLLADLTVDGVLYDSVGARFKGQTSYFQLPQNAEKMSFNITLDHVHNNQDVMSYNTLNLNNAFQDASFLREVVYLELIRDHIPAAKANFVRLHINGENWGLYPNVQQVDKDFIQEWFFDDEGARWRADRSDGQMGGMWGDGTAALNDLGPDTADYQTYYTLKGSGTTDPWTKLVQVCQKLEGLPLAQFEDSLAKYIDLDRTLWFLASEIAFSDDDGYAHKGKMDYYLYWEPESGRMIPQEFDGNSVMKTNAVNWSAFYHETDANYPLLNRILAVPRLRQRYLAHMRTLIEEKLQPSVVSTLLDGYEAMIDTIVQNDPKKLYTYNAFQNELNVLQTYVTNRRNFLLSNSEVSQPAPTISDVEMEAGGTIWQAPDDQTSAWVRATVTATNGISAVRLFYSDQLEGRFQNVLMADDGAHQDGASGDGVYGGEIPAYGANSYVRFYVEATANNPAQTVSYAPPGAEHDVYVYRVSVETAAFTGVVINELMASNSATAADAAGEYEDWIELYNNGTVAVDLSGGFLTDDGQNLTKWTIPPGSIIQPNGYLIFWADEDTQQGDGHTNFKLSASGEEVWLVSPDTAVMDQVVFGDQSTDLGYARVPNGTGGFVPQAPTFAANNDLPSGLDEVSDRIQAFHFFPNPSTGALTILSNEAEDIMIHDAMGRTLWSGRVNGRIELDLSDLAQGTYTIRSASGVTERLVLVR